MKALSLLALALLLSGCGDAGSQGAGPTDPESIKQSQKEQNAAADAESKAAKTNK